MAMQTPYSVSRNQGAAGMAASHSAPVSAPLTGQAAELSEYTRTMEGRYAAPVVAANGEENVLSGRGGNAPPPDYNLWAAPPCDQIHCGHGSQASLSRQRVDYRCY